MPTGFLSTTPNASASASSRRRHLERRRDRVLHAHEVGSRRRAEARVQCDEPVGRRRCQIGTLRYLGFCSEGLRATPAPQSIQYVAESTRRPELLRIEGLWSAGASHVGRASHLQVQAHLGFRRASSADDKKELTSVARSSGPSSTIGRHRSARASHATACGSLEDSFDRGSEQDRASSSLDPETVAPGARRYLLTRSPMLMPTRRNDAWTLDAPRRSRRGWPDAARVVATRTRRSSSPRGASRRRSISSGTSCPASLGSTSSALTPNHRKALAQIGYKLVQPARLALHARRRAPVP